METKGKRKKRKIKERLNRKEKMARNGREEQGQWKVRKMDADRGREEEKIEVEEKREKIIEKEDEENQDDGK